MMPETQIARNETEASIGTPTGVTTPLPQDYPPARAATDETIPLERATAEAANALHAMQAMRSDVFDVTNLLVSLPWFREVNVDHAQRLWLPDRTTWTAAQLFRDLAKEGYVKKREWAIPRIRGGPPIRQLAMWSLTRRGYQLVRDEVQFPMSPAEPRARTMLPHDAMTVETIVRIIELGRLAGLSSLWLEHEVRLDPARSRPVMDTFLVVRLGGDPASSNRVPWTNDGRTAGERSGRLAIENDRGSEGRRELEEKARSYMRAGTAEWVKRYGDFPTPTIIAPTLTRMTAILRWWAPVWPEGRYFLTCDAWLAQDRWVEFRGGHVRERRLFAQLNTTTARWVPITAWHIAEAANVSRGDGA